MLAGIYTPVVTIMTQSGQIDLQGNLALQERLIQAGVDGLVPMGTTGEFIWFSRQQKEDFLREYIRAADGRVELLPGVGGLEYQDTVALANTVCKERIKGVLIGSEFYFNMSPQDFYNYYAYMAEHIDGRIYIYNYPARTGNDIPPEIVAQLADRYSNIVGLKDSVVSFSHTRQVLEQVLPLRPDFQVFSGFDDQFLDNLAMGGAGSIGALSNIVPDIWAAWVKAASTGDQEGITAGAKQIQTLMPIYSLESNPQKLLKELLRSDGMDISTHCHFPFDYLTEGSLEKALAFISQSRI